MGRYRAGKRRRTRAALAVGAALVAAGAAYAAWTHFVSPPPETSSPEPVIAAPIIGAEPAATAVPAVLEAAGTAETPPEPSPPWLPLDTAWQASGLPAPPAGWLEAYAQVTAVPCARLELEGGSATLLARVLAPSAELAARLEAIALAISGVGQAGSDLVDPESAACRLLDLLNQASLPSPALMARLDQPLDTRCAVPPCYAGVAERRLRDGERLVLTVTTPPVVSHLSVDYLQPDGTVVHLYPRADGQPSASQAGDALWIGDPRAGAAYVERSIAPPFGRGYVLVLASPTPLLPAGRAETEASADFLDALAGALAAQEGPARPLASVLTFETTPLPP